MANSLSPSNFDASVGNVPHSKSSLFSVLHAFLEDCYDDPVVEIMDCGSSELRIRVAQERGGPKYYRVKIVEEA